MIPDGLLVTVPVPPPVGATASMKLGITVKVAVTVVLVVGVITHVPVPLHPPPLHPVKVEPAAAEAVRVTCVPSGNIAAHALLLALQLMLAGLLVTWPLPLPASATVRVGGLMKLPKAWGPKLTAIGLPTTVLLAVAITETLFEPWFAT